MPSRKLSVALEDKETHSRTNEAQSQKWTGVRTDCQRQTQMQPCPTPSQSQCMFFVAQRDTEAIFLAIIPTWTAKYSLPQLCLLHYLASFIVFLFGGALNFPSSLLLRLTDLSSLSRDMSVWPCLSGLLPGWFQWRQTMTDTGSFLVTFPHFLSFHSCSLYKKHLLSAVHASLSFPSSSPFSIIRRSCY